MPISATGGNATQFNPAAAMTPAAGGSPQAGMPGLPSFDFKSPSTPTDPTYGNIISMLTQSPTSMTNTVMPYLQSLFGQQNSMASNIFANQGSQGAAQAQSNAMARGMTGSSIEQSGIQGAYAQANQGYDQFMMNALGNLGQSYMTAAGQDVNTQNGMYQNLAQAMGQQMQSQIAQSEFERQLQAGIQAAQNQSQSNIWGGVASGLGAIGGGLLAHSDIRLKKNIEKIGEREGFPVYSFEYDQDRAPELELPLGKFVGFMAHHIAEKYPKAVSVVRGYLMLDYSKLPTTVLA